MESTQDGGNRPSGTVKTKPGTDQARTAATGQDDESCQARDRPRADGDNRPSGTVKTKPGTDQTETDRNNTSRAEPERTAGRTGTRTRNETEPERDRTDHKNKTTQTGPERTTATNRTRRPRRTPRPKRAPASEGRGFLAVSDWRWLAGWLAVGAATAGPRTTPRLPPGG